MPLDGGVEDALHAAQVLTDLLDLLRNSEKEVHVLFFVAAEVMDADIPDLAVAGNTTVSLLELRRRPRNVVMDDPPAALLHVDAFGGGIGRQEQPHGGSRVFKLRLHRLELIDVHAAVEQPQGVLVEAFLKKPLFEVEQRLLVLGEDDEPFVVTQLAASEQVLLDPGDQGLGLRVGLLGEGSELAGVFDGSPVVAEGFQRLVHTALKVLDAFGSGSER